MNEKRLQEYLELIKKLLSCSTDEEINQILVENKNLLDVGFLQTVATEVEKVSNEGDESTANRLRYLANARDKAFKSSPSVPKASPAVNIKQILESLKEDATNFLRDLANALGEALNTSTTVDIKQSLESLKEAEFQPYGRFLAEVLQATYESEGSKQIVYPLLVANISILDANLADVMQRWATSIFKEAKSIALAIGIFSKLIRQFPLGDKANNIEIAITGYEVILRICSRDAYPEMWAMAQHDLGNAYFTRIKGNKADNIERAIAAYNAALEIRIRENFPYEWAGTQNNLGNAYIDRIKGNKVDNIEKAIAFFKAALGVRTRKDFPKLFCAIAHS